MFLPYATDAPVYHFPFATIGLIIANIAIFVGIGTVAEDGTAVGQAAGLWLESLTLQSNRIAPWQWLTTNFLHGDILHLLGNMMFLWIFGLVVEGKIGWWRFLVLYCLIGVVYGALVQVGMYLLMDDYQVVLGASAAIFGLIGLAVVWAPRNDINVLTWFIVPRTFEIPILMLGFAYFALHLVSLAATRFQLSSELLHMVGLGIGLPLGVFLLKREWVDCEGWDLMTVLAGNTGSEDVRASAQLLADRQQHDEDRQDRHRATIVRSFGDALAAANLPVAQAIFRKNQTLFSAQHPWPAGLLKQLIRALHDAKEWEASVPAMGCLIDQSAEPMTAVRLRLAQIQFQVCQRPHKCLQLLASLPENLAPQQAELRRRLSQAAQRAIAEGRSELEFDDGD